MFILFFQLMSSMKKLMQLVEADNNEGSWDEAVERNFKEHPPPPTLPFIIIMIKPRRTCRPKCKRQDIIKIERKEIPAGLDLSGSR